MALILTVVFYFFSIATSFFLYYKLNMFDSYNYEFSIFCILFILVAEWLCIFAFKHPLIILGKTKKQEEFYNLRDNIIESFNKVGKPFIEIKEYFDKRKQELNANWGLSILSKNGRSSYLTYEEVKEVRVYTYYSKINTSVLVFFRNRCNNLRTFFFFFLILYSVKCGSMPAECLIILFLFITYIIVVNSLIYGVGVIGEMIIKDGFCITFEAIFNKDISSLVKDKDDSADDLSRKLVDCFSFYTCPKCRRTFFNFLRNEIDVREPDFSGYTTEKTTYKDVCVGRISQGDDTLARIYDTKPDKTTITAYGSRTIGSYCPHCREKLDEISFGTTAQKTYTHRY
ncbi:MAG: hypothetical protein E7348_01425 [Clostridiales bacterium]|nr:hypothetical protein [Clostridiales bacterium]